MGPLNTAHCLAFGDSFFEYKKKHPDHMARFVSFAGAFVSDVGAYSAQSIARAYLWWALPGGSLVVHGGGGIEPIASAMASHSRILICDIVLPEPNTI
ncbi:hypothetical protein C7999DRAFT_33477 [Corynascus novoguineensis]|uniref:Uncharacterized protein n=1 Tax=Corynascus novoguineensis TaxID=1126955 RepID=A0AAN7CRX6_9PEZI|nr:hypothetical protein C7999DRAFT_33477 [Corynascus novoguineensis]